MSTNRNKAKRMRQKRRRRFFGTLLTLYLLVALVMITGVSFSGYVTTGSAEDSARAAKFSVTDDLATELAQFEIKMAPGDEPKNYSIEVTNNSEVAVRYTVTAIRETENLPLNITVNNPTGVIAANDSNPIAVPVTVAWQLDEAAKDYQYSHEIDLMTVQLTVEQVD